MKKTGVKKTGEMNKYVLPEELGVSLDTIILAMRLEGISQKDIGKKLHIAQQTVSKKLQNIRIEGLDEFKKHRANLFALLVSNIYAAFTPEKVKEMSGRDLAFCLEKVAREERFERGQTGLGKTYKELTDREKELEAEEKELRAQIEKFERKGKVVNIKRGGGGKFV